MGKKYFAWSFDDGLEQDRKIVEILRKYHMGATFHLNSGLFGDRTYEGRIGNLGMKEIPAASGVTYARTIGTAKDFSFPEDPLALPMTGWHVKKDVFDKLRRFLDAPAEANDLFFLMFAHGCEFDFGTKESNWEKFESICRLVSGRPDVICCSVGDALRMHKGEAPVFDRENGSVL